MPGQRRLSDDAARLHPTSTEPTTCWDLSQRNGRLWILHITLLDVLLLRRRATMMCCCGLRCHSTMHCTGSQIRGAGASAPSGSTPRGLLAVPERASPRVDSGQSGPRPSARVDGMTDEAGPRSGFPLMPLLGQPGPTRGRMKSSMAGGRSWLRRHWSGFLPTCAMGRGCLSALTDGHGERSSLRLDGLDPADQDASGCRWTRKRGQTPKGIVVLTEPEITQCVGMDREAIEVVSVASRNWRVAMSRCPPSCVSTFQSTRER